MSARSGDSFSSNGLLTDLPLESGPQHILDCVYKNNILVNQGNVLTIDQTQECPSQLKWPVERGQLYTIIMCDPDAPSRESPKWRNFLHWCIVNIPGDEISKGAKVMDYMGPAPPRGTGLHRYVFLVYKQGQEIGKPSIEDRKNWSLTNFVKSQPLQLLSGNFFQCQHA